MKSAAEIREQILRTVSQTGGHLASSLGAVEICMALAEVFDPKKDKVVFDVGHQAYAWKILTDRAEKFGTLRQLDGLSGFPNPLESPYDAAIAGHAGVALSVAEGYAAARDRRGSDEHIIAVIGDSSIVNGTSFEALNNCAAATNKVIIILNDNEMSISKPAGSFACFLGRLITNVRYNRVKAAAEKAGHALKLTFLRGLYHLLESRIKSLFLANSYFENFGIRYIGPVDGHDLAALKDSLTVAKEDKRSVIIHVVTKKGKGFAPAERNPTAWHGVGAFDLEKAVLPEAKRDTWSDVFGRAVAEVARKDRRVVTLTAGMMTGTGLSDFAKEFPDRFFDVGIAEGHMVAFAAGLAAGGMRPVVAIYSTFLQRAVDQVMHDVAIAGLPVIFCVDRAGIVGADGVTHQGLYDFPMLRALPGLTIVEPTDSDDLKVLLKEALDRNSPTVIRYPRGKAARHIEPLAPTKVPRAALWVTADWLEKANAISAALGDVEVVPARQMKPFDKELLAKEREKGLKIVSLENSCLQGGLGEMIGADVRFGWPDEYIPQGKPAELEARYGLDAASVIKALQQGS